MCIGTRFAADSIVICAKSDAKRCGSGQGLGQILLSSARKVMQKDLDRDEV